MKNCAKSGKEISITGTSSEKKVRHTPAPPSTPITTTDCRSDRMIDTFLRGKYNLSSKKVYFIHNFNLFLES